MKRKLLMFLLTMTPLLAWCDNITFADAKVKEICVANWDTNGDGELSYEEAAAVTNLGTVFRGKQIAKFEELQYFTGLTSIAQYAFQECNLLTNIIFPEGLESLGDYVFYNCTKLESISFPSTMKNYGRCTVYGVSSLKQIIINSLEPPTNNFDGFFQGISDSFNIYAFTWYVPKGKREAYYNPIPWWSGKARGIVELGEDEEIISFADQEVKRLCVAKYDGNYSGELDVIEAAEVTKVDFLPLSKEVFKGNTTIRTFDEFSYFTGLEKIEDESFRGCTSLTSIVLPGNLKEIGSSSFRECGKLLSVTIPESVTKIGGYTFYECSNLKKVSIPYSVTSIGSMAFDDCDALTEVHVGMIEPISIESSTFSNYSNATLYVPKGSKAAYETANYWKNFKEIIEDTSDEPITFADENVKAICVANWDTSGDGELSYAEAAAVTDLGDVFKGNEQIQSFDEFSLFTGITSIGDTCFVGCKSLVSITIPATVETIADGAFGCGYFGECSSLVSINVPGESPYFSSIDGVLFNKDATELYCYPKGKSETGYSVPSTVKNIRNLAFHGRERLTNIEFPNSLESIGELSFEGCHGLETVVIPNSVTGIGYYAFRACTGITSLTLSNKLNRINHQTFAGLYSLTSLIIPSSVETIIATAFADCTQLKYVSIPKNTSSIGEDAFANCPNMISFNVDPENQYYTSVDGIIYSKNMEELHWYPGNSDMEIYEIPNTVKTIKGTAFSSATPKIKKIVIPKTVTTIGDYTFLNCSGLTSIDIPNSVTTIGAIAFYGLKGLTSIDIPNSVTTIGDEAFRYCDNLTEVKVGMASPVAITEEVFSNRANATLYVPKGSKAAYEAADYWKEFKEIIEIADPNELNAEPVKLLTGKTKPVSLSLENQDEIIMVEFELQLPDGFEIAKDEDGELIAELNSERIAKSHTLEVADHGNGKYKFLLYSSKNAALKGNTGELLHFDITCGKDVADGTYQATVSSIILSDTQENGIYPSDFTFDIIAVNAIPGDVNGDENINGLDIVKIVGYIMGSPTQPFVEAAADLNEDEVINGLDLVKLVSLVLSQSSTQSAAGAKAMRAAVRVAEKELQLDEEGHGMLRMGTAEAGRYILSQFTVVTDGSVSINDITTDGSHVVVYRQTGENRYAVVCYSQTNATFMMNSDIMKIHYTGNGSISIQDAMMVDEDENLVHFSDVSNLGTTSIEGIVSEMKPADIYTVGGKLVKKDATTLNGLPKGVYVVNNQKVIIK